MSNFINSFLPADVHKVFATRDARAAVCVVSNRKGGTGKTTLTMAIAEGLAVLAGKRILLIDADRQANLSTAFGLSEKHMGETPHVFSETGVRPDELFIPPIHPDYEEGDDFAPRSSSAEIMEIEAKSVLPYDTFLDSSIQCLKSVNPLGGCIDVLPADGARLQYIQTHAETYDTKTLYKRWACWLVESNALWDYDAIVFDAPPLDSALHQALYQLCDHVVVPVQPNNDTLSAASAIAFSCFSAQNSDERPRTMTTIVNPLRGNRLTKPQKDWLKKVVWGNQALGALPESNEFPNATIIDERRSTPLMPYSVEFFESLDADERRKAEKDYAGEIRKLLLPARTVKSEKNTRDSYKVVISHLHSKFFNEPLPADPFFKDDRASSNA